MKINILKILDKSEIELKLDFKLPLEEMKYSGKKIKFNKPIEVNGGIYRSDDDIIISGNIIYEYTDSCDRCLKEFQVKSETNLTANVVTKSDQINDYEELTVILKGSNVDLDQVIISSILTDLPMKSLCDEHCKGFCGKCGKNLNEDQCDCDDVDVDPRLAKLKDLLD